MIKFECKESEATERLTFDMVEVDQFFIDKDGWLCQKTSSSEYFSIACSSNKPCAYRHSVSWSTEIKKILPTVKRITWGNDE